MRVEYSINNNNFVQDCLTNIESFLSTCNGYVIHQTVTFHPNPQVLPNYNIDYYYLVVKNTDYDIYLIFFGWDYRIGVFASTDFDATKSDIWFNENVICTAFGEWKLANATAGNPYDSALFQRYVHAHYFPVACISGSEDTEVTLVCNYHTTNNTVLLSGIEKFDMDYGECDITRNIAFGGVTKYQNYTGGFFWGGDYIYLIELYNMTSRHKVSAAFEDFLESGACWVPDSKIITPEWHKKYLPPIQVMIAGDTFLLDPYTDSNRGHTLYNSTQLPDTNNISNFHAFLRIDVDNAPNREHDVLPDTLIEIGYNTYIPQINRQKIWASTIGDNYYVPMVISICGIETGLPTYYPLMTHDIGDIGHTVNTLNKVSMIFELYFMCMRDPWLLNDYSLVGYNDIVNYVNMRYMSTNRLKECKCLTRADGEFNCFNSGTRRGMFGTKGYNGLAFRQEV